MSKQIINTQGNKIMKYEFTGDATWVTSPDTANTLNYMLLA